MDDETRGPQLPFQLEGTTNQIVAPPLPQEQEDEFMASDASDFQEFAFSLLDSGFVHIQSMSPLVTQLTSGHRELKSVLNTFKIMQIHCTPYIPRWYIGLQTQQIWLA